MAEKLDLDGLKQVLINSAMGLTFRECHALIDYAQSLEADNLELCGVAQAADAERRALESRASNAGEAVAEVVSAHGDPEAFGEREIKVLADLSRIPYGTPLYTRAALATAQTVPALEKLKALKNVTLTITRNDHAAIYQTLEEWLCENVDSDRGCYDVTPEDRAEITRTGECWTLQWYPNTPVGFNAVAAATLDRCIEIAAPNAPESRKEE